MITYLVSFEVTCGTFRALIVMFNFVVFIVNVSQEFCACECGLVKPMRFSITCLLIMFDNGNIQVEYIFKLVQCIFYRLRCIVGLYTFDICTFYLFNYDFYNSCYPHKELQIQIVLFFQACIQRTPFLNVQ